jgi:protein TonB
MEMAFSSNGLIYALSSIIFAIVGVIVYFRYRLNHFTPQDLKKKHQTDSNRQSIMLRNKFPEVDVFRLSSSFLSFSLLLSLFLTLAAMNLTEADEIIRIPDGAMNISDDIQIDVPRSSEPPPPPPPPPPPVITEIPDNLLIDEEQPSFVDQSIDRETKVFAPDPQENKQSPPPPPPPPPIHQEEEIFVIAEDMPRFPGCEEMATKKEKEECARQKLLEYVYANIQYPAIARENGVEGTVVVSFVVEKTGEVKEVKLIRDIGGGCGDEALRVVNMMNAKNGVWMPGKQRGKPVRVLFNLPIKFQLK